MFDFANTINKVVSKCLSTSVAEIQLSLDAIISHFDERVNEVTRGASVSRNVRDKEIDDTTNQLFADIYYRTCPQDSGRFYSIKRMYRMVPIFIIKKTTEKIERDYWAKYRNWYCSMKEWPPKDCSQYLPFNTINRANYQRTTADQQTTDFIALVETATGKAIELEAEVLRNDESKRAAKTARAAEKLSEAVEPQYPMHLRNDVKYIYFPLESYFRETVYEFMPHEMKRGIFDNYVDSAITRILSLIPKDNVSEKMVMEALNQLFADIYLINPNGEILRMMEMIKMCIRYTVIAELLEHYSTEYWLQISNGNEWDMNQRKKYFSKTEISRLANYRATHKDIKGFVNDLNVAVGRAKQRADTERAETERAERERGP